MKPGNAGGLHYDSYSTLFPPGKPAVLQRSSNYVELFMGQNTSLHVDRRQRSRAFDLRTTSDRVKDGPRLTRSVDQSWHILLQQKSILDQPCAGGSQALGPVVQRRVAFLKRESRIAR
jgi:hypothetical protein